MLTANNHWRCDICGRFIRQADIESGAAISNQELVVVGWDPPDADYEWVNYHKACRDKQMRELKECQERLQKKYENEPPKGDE